jgi:MFS family permease
VLGLFAAASAIGQLVTGALSDHYDLNWIIGVTSVSSSVSIFVLWGYSEGFAMLAAFAIVCKSLLMLG